MKHNFVIRGRFYGDKTFPSLNDYLHECGKNPKNGGKMKRDYMMVASNAIRLQLRRLKVNRPIILHYRFYEPRKGQRRDFMNIFSLADKVIQDALQQCKVIPDDGPDWVKNTTHEFYYTDKEPWIEVVIEEL